MAHTELNLRERCAIEDLLNAHSPAREIAAEIIESHVSAVYRDIMRNRYTDGELPELNGYQALASQDMCERRQAIHRKMVVHPELKAAIEDHVKHAIRLKTVR